MYTSINGGGALCGPVDDMEYKLTVCMTLHNMAITDRCRDVCVAQRRRSAGNRAYYLYRDGAFSVSEARIVAFENRIWYFND